MQTRLCPICLLVFVVSKIGSSMKRTREPIIKIAKTSEPCKKLDIPIFEMHLLFLLVKWHRLQAISEI